MNRAEIFVIGLFADETGKFEEELNNLIPAGEPWHKIEPCDCGGLACLGTDVFVAIIEERHLDWDRFKDTVKNVPIWDPEADPDDIQLLIRTEHEDRFTLYSRDEFLAHEF